MKRRPRTSTDKIFSPPRRPERSGYGIRAGFALIEVMVGMLITAMLAASFFVLVTQSLRLSRINLYDMRASLYLREEIEAARDLEQSAAWAAVLGDPSSPCLSSLCHPRPQSGAWTLVSGQEALEGGRYLRSLSIEPVCRDTLSFPNQIVACDGVAPEDPNTRKIVARIAWNNSAVDRTAKLETYVYNSP